MQIALQKEVSIASFVVRFNTVNLESLADTFAGTWNNLLKQSISLKFLLTEGLV